jgi:chemotaxis protein MotD
LYDQSPAKPFASLLDDNAAPDNPPPPASDDRVSRADQADQARRVARDDDAQNSRADAGSDNADTKSADVKSDGAKSAHAKSHAKSDDAKANDAKSDSKPADANAADQPAAGTPAVIAGKTAKSGVTTGNSKAIADGQAAAEVKTAGQSASADDAKPADGAKSADGQAPAVAVTIAAAAPVVTPVVTGEPADGSAVAANPIEVSGSPAAAMAANNISLVTTPKAKAGAAPGQQLDIGKAAAAAAAKLPAQAGGQVGGQAAAQPQTDDKPQAAAGEAEKTAVAQARGEVATKEQSATPKDAAVALPPDANGTAPKTVADATQPTGLQAPTQTTPTTAAASAAAPNLAPQAAAIPLSGLAVEIATKAGEGKNHFDIRLDPPELGRIEVRLAVDKDGNVTSRLIADRSDTLDLLRRDHATLERALQDAGLKTADNSLQFQLRDHSSQPQQDNSGTHRSRLVIEDTTLPPVDTAQRGYSRLAGQGRGLDIHV